MINNESHAENAEMPARVDRSAELAAVPDTLRRLLGERSAEDLRHPGQDGGNAVVEILCHLQDWEEINGERVWRVLHETTPELESFDDSLWSIEHDYISRDGLDALNAFSILREKMVELLATIDNNAFQRTAALQNHGTITLAWLIQSVARHDEKHIAELGEALS